MDGGDIDLEDVVDLKLELLVLREISSLSLLANERACCTELDFAEASLVNTAFSVDNDLDFEELDDDVDEDLIEAMWDDIIDEGFDVEDESIYGITDEDSGDNRVEFDAVENSSMISFVAWHCSLVPITHNEK